MKQIKLTNGIYFYPLQTRKEDYEFYYYPSDGKEKGNFLIHGYNKSNNTCNAIVFTKLFTLNGVPQYNGGGVIKWVI